jgi:hypothetical protein
VIPKSYLMPLFIAGLLIGGCALPSATVNVEPAGSPLPEWSPSPTTVVTPLAEGVPSPQPGATLPGEATPTSTLVVRIAPETSPTPEAPGAAATGAPQTASSPIPTALVDPELVALWEYVLQLEQEVAVPLAEMQTTLEELGLGSGQADIAAICTGVDVVVATMAEVQQGLDAVGAPPSDDSDLQEAYAELNAAADDLEQGSQLLQSACQTMNLGPLLESATYLESGAQHIENAGQAVQRWEDRVGL